jgi:ABC-type sugar transport system substrate-binding protein
MYMKKIVTVLMVLAVCVGMVSAKNSKKKDKPIIMGALIRNLNETFVRDYADNLKKLAKENNVQLKLLDGNSDVATQLDQLKTLLSQGIKYFVIIPQDTGATEQMSQLINAKGGAAAFSNIQPSVAALKVGKNFYFASSPETVAGDYQAQIIDSYFKKYPDKAPGKIVNMILINGQLGHPAQISRKAGVVNGLRSRGYTVNIIAEDTANWGAAEAQAKMDAWLAAFAGKFNVVVAQNDDMALGAIESMLTNKYTDDPKDVTKDTNGDGTVLKVPVLGIDATETGRRSMKENKMYATVLQDSVGQSTTAFELVYQCAKNGTAIGYTTKAGISAAKEVTDEAPVTDVSILPQCFLVPFKPITR